MAEEGENNRVLLVGLDKEVSGDGGLAVGVGAVEVDLQGVALDQGLTDGEDLVVDGLDGLVVLVGGTVGGDDTVLEGLGAVDGGEPGEEGELLVAEGQGGVHLVADLAVGGTAEGHLLADGLDVQTRLDVILQAHLVAGADVLEEARAVHGARLEGEGVAVEHEVVQRVARRGGQSGPVVHLGLVDLLRAVGAAGEEIEVHVGIGGGLLEVDVGIQIGVGVEGLVAHVEAVSGGNVLVASHGGGDLRLGFTQERITEITVRDGHADAVLGAQLQHLPLVLHGGQGLLARAHDPVDPRVSQELVLLVGDVLGRGGPEDGDHDVLVKGVLGLYHLDRAGDGLVQGGAGSGDGGFAQLLGSDGTVGGHGGYRGIRALEGDGEGVLGAHEDGGELVGLAHEELQHGAVERHVGGGGTEDGDLTQLCQRAVGACGGVALDDVEPDELGLLGGEAVGLGGALVDGHTRVLGHLLIGLAVGGDLNFILGGELAVGEEGHGADLGGSDQLQGDGDGLGVVHLPVVGLAGPTAIADLTVGQVDLGPGLGGHLIAVLGACPLVGAGRNRDLGVLGDQDGAARRVLVHALGGEGREDGGVSHGGGGAQGHEDGEGQGQGAAGGVLLGFHFISSFERVWCCDYYTTSIAISQYFFNKTC